MAGGHPEVPRFLQRADGSPDPQYRESGDPSLRLRNGYAQDDRREDPVVCSRIEPE